MEGLSPEDEVRFGTIEGRGDLFETKILRIEQGKKSRSNQEMKHVLIASRDPGSANALLPVMENMKHENFSMTVITDGRAQEIIQKKFKTENITPTGMVLEADTVIGKADGILTDSSTSNMGLETYSVATYHEVPTVLVEDYYTSCLPYLEAMTERHLPLPDKICVMDKAAQALVIEKYPELTERVVVTGQPAFDRFAHEPTEQIKHITREKLKLKQGERLISYMSTFTPDFPSSEEAIKALAEQFATMGHDSVIAFRRHPRDNTPYEEYEAAFHAHGIRTVETNSFSTDEISAASDLVITTWSTEGLNAIYRRKPTIHLIDPNIMKVPESLTMPIPPVKLGASIGLNRVEELGSTIKALSQPSDTTAQMENNMEKYYPLDGRNSERVLTALKQTLSAQKQ